MRCFTKSTFGLGKFAVSIIQDAEGTGKKISKFRNFFEKNFHFLISNDIFETLISGLLNIASFGFFAFTVESR